MISQVEDSLDTIVIYVIFNVLEIIFGHTQGQKGQILGRTDTQNHGIEGNQEDLFEKCRQRTLFE